MIHWSQRLAFRVHVYVCTGIYIHIYVHVHIRHIYFYVCTYTHMHINIVYVYVDKHGWQSLHFVWHVENIVVLCGYVGR